MIYFSGWDEKGVKSFNSRTGNVVLESIDVTDALGFTPVESFNTRTGAVTLESGDVTDALGFTPVAENIYTADGSITGTRKVTLNGRVEFADASEDNQMFFDVSGHTFFVEVQTATLASNFTIGLNDISFAVNDLTSGDVILMQFDLGVGALIQDDVFSRGLTAAADYSASYNDLTYTQKVYVDPRTDSIVTAANLAPNVDQIDNQVITLLASNLTLDPPTGTPKNGQKLMFRITATTTPRTFTWDAVYRFPSDISRPAALSDGPIYVEFIYNSDADTWDCIRFITSF